MSRRDYDLLDVVANARQQVGLIESVLHIRLSQILHVRAVLNENVCTYLCSSKFSDIVPMQLPVSLDSTQH